MNKKFVFDFDLDLWIKNLEIEADNLEEAKEKLCDMSVRDIIDNASIRDFSISTLDCSVEDDDEEEDDDDIEEDLEENGEEIL